MFTVDEQEHGLFGAVTEWLKHPFNAQGSVFNWALFTGMLLVFLWMWNWILINLSEVE